jgi:hypothetical protein
LGIGGSPRLKRLITSSGFTPRRSEDIVDAPSNSVSSYCMAIDGGDIGDGMTIPDYAAIGLLIVLLMLWPRLDAKRLAAEKPRGS